jgi:16S rRNA (guanine527-N7)-methyltransferase
LETGLEKLGIDLGSKEKDDLLAYMDHVLSYNKSVNLTSIHDECAFIELHILDSLTVLKYIEKNARVIDIGTGAGFPGAVLKLARGDLHVTFVESVGKKINFVERTLSQMDIDRFACLNGRAEVLSTQKDYRQKFDVCVSRAVAPLPVLAELCMPFVRAGGKFIAMKGAAGLDELNGLGEAYRKIADADVETQAFRLPFSSAQRILAIFNVNGAVNSGYPRPYKEIKRRPLGS